MKFSSFHETMLHLKINIADGYFNFELQYFNIMYDNIFLKFAQINITYIKELLTEYIQTQDDNLHLLLILMVYHASMVVK